MSIDKHSFEDHVNRVHWDHIHRCSPGNYLQTQRERDGRASECRGRANVTGADDIRCIACVGVADLASADDSIARAVV